MDFDIIKQEPLLFDFEGMSLYFNQMIDGGISVIIESNGLSSVCHLTPTRVAALKSWINKAIQMPLEPEEGPPEEPMFTDSALNELEEFMINFKKAGEAIKSRQQGERINKVSVPISFVDKADELIYNAGYRDGAKALAEYLDDHPGKIEGNGDIDSFVSRLNSVTHEFTEDL